MRFHRLIGSSILVLTAAAGAAHAQETTIYQYDALGRLVQASASRGSSNATSSYTLDAAGNRTNVTVIASTTPTPGASCVITIPDYSFTLVKYGAPYNGLSQVLPGAGCTGAVTLGYSTQDGTATAGNYAPASGTITIPPGSTIIRYPLNSLSIYGAESLEFYVNFTVVSGAATLTKPQATIWLNAD